ncbi:hypothetical protein NVP1122B_69 [Vibrio phage 1.122.B._10N.286.46.F8]|nr:hypothetical protein NVP1122A_69 [Vibrio phage 1.122.A._10N.286.46.F8]AUR89429.1 hypothetical protein NVP1122B_69 [Vibrio phage 1.122.B._10N.286.46.F8]
MTKLYRSHKLALATPMNRIDYNIYRGWELPSNENGSDEGYLVEYLDSGEPNHPEHKGYISWSPKGVFDSGHSEEREDLKGRLIKESECLEDKINNLGIMLNKGKPDFIDTKHWELMVNQHVYMFSYHEILIKRIKLLS